jgi:1-phosphofructokinase family hexose kinase
VILTLTVNPAIDRNVLVDRLVFEDRTYILSTRESPGGRGINASCVIHSFGGKTRAIAVSGGKSGAKFQELLECCGYPVEVVPIRNPLRINLTITDKQGLSVKLNEFGPAMSPSEVARLEKAVAARLPVADWLLIFGSLPPGVPPRLYSKLVAMARERKVKTMLDTDGDALLEGVEAGPAVVSPNQQEAERLLGTALITRTHFLDAAARIQAMGAESVILSLGSRGAVAAYRNHMIEVLAPHVDALCPIGSGDAMAAAFVWAISKKNDFADALRWGVAAGTASARLPGVSFASLEQTKEIYKLVEVRAVK